MKWPPSLIPFISIYSMASSMNTIRRSLNSKIIVTGLSISCLVLAGIMHSRAFVIGYILSIGCIWLAVQPKRMNTKWWWLLLPAFFLSAVGLASFFKTDSSLGRLLVYKLTWIMFKDH